METNKIEPKKIDWIDAVGMGALWTSSLAVAGLAQAQQKMLGEKDERIKSLKQRNAELMDFFKAWKPIADVLNERRKTLNKFNLMSTINALPEPIKSAYNESIVSFLFGKDLAAASIACLIIEGMIREKSCEYDARLEGVINRMAARNIISPHLQNKLHILQRVRNLHSHHIQKLRELDLLALFQAVDDLVKELGYGG